MRRGIAALRDMDGGLYYRVVVADGELVSTGEARSFWGARRMVRRFVRLHEKGITVDA